MKPPPWYTEPPDDWNGNELPIEAFIGEAGFDRYETEDDMIGCPLVGDLYRGAFELAEVLEDRRLRPSEVLALKGATDTGYIFWRFVDPRLSSAEAARLAGAIVLYECGEHILQVARFKGHWKVFKGLPDLPLNALEQLEDEEPIDADDARSQPDQPAGDSPVEDDLTEEDLERRRLRDIDVRGDG